MITDEERRQIAYRLRAEAVNWRDFAKDDTLFDMCDAAFVESILGAFQLSDMDMHVCEAFDMLAAIIDRPTCHNMYDENKGCANGFTCSTCGHVVEDYEGYRVSGTWNYCPNCGAEVVDDED